MRALSACKKHSRDSRCLHPRKPRTDIISRLEHSWTHSHPPTVIKSRGSIVNLSANLNYASKPKPLHAKSWVAMRHNQAWTISWGYSKHLPRCVEMEKDIPESLFQPWTQQAGGHWHCFGDRHWLASSIVHSPAQSCSNTQIYITPLHS